MLAFLYFFLQLTLLNLFKTTIMAGYYPETQYDGGGGGGELGLTGDTGIGFPILLLHCSCLIKNTLFLNGIICRHLTRLIFFYRVILIISHQNLTKIWSPII